MLVCARINQKNINGIGASDFLNTPSLSLMNDFLKDKDERNIVWILFVKGDVRAVETAINCQKGLKNLKKKFFIQNSICIFITTMTIHQKKWRNSFVI